MGQVEGNSIQPHCICPVLSTQASLAPNSLGPGFSPLENIMQCPMLLYTVSFWNFSAWGMAVFHPLLYPTCPHMLLLCNRCSIKCIKQSIQFADRTRQGWGSPVAGTVGSTSASWRLQLIVAWIEPGKGLPIQNGMGMCSKKLIPMLFCASWRSRVLGVLRSSAQGKTFLFFKN